ncbi:M20 family metallopeptidase [Desulfovibrio sp. OttesenSCG-928-I05]|nr:M20 family metallopeptidase [Desulfovibrio sp. OttesenSCG-928-I05]
MDIAKKVDGLAESVIAFRRYIHENAELGMKEVLATKRIVEELRKLPGIEVQDTAPGCIAVLKGKKPGKTLALRADMDALPMVEESGLPFASKNGACHSCGHDIHTSVLLGSAMVLSSMADQISGTIKFLFQPAEETLEGAVHLLKHNAMDGVDNILALHTWPYGRVGTIGYKRGPMQASADMVDITVTGRAGHAAYPQKSIDSVLIAAQIVTALQAVVARQTDPLEAAVLTLGTINGGTARNIIAPEVVMTGTVRTLSPEVRKNMPGLIERIATNVAEAFGAKVDVNYMMGTPPVVNDNSMVDVLIEAATQVVGAENVYDLETPTMGGEDYAFYLEKAPGAFFRLCTANDDPQTQIAAHNAKIRYDESAIPLGMKVMCQAALNYLK